MNSPILGINGVSKTARICAWHENGEGTSKMFERLGFRITHGICAECRGKIQFTLEHENEVDHELREQQLELSS